MAGMKRFVTYIYGYEERQKKNNVGFAKIEVRGEECQIEIHLREIYTGEDGCSVYLFRENGGSIEGVPIGEMKLVRGRGDFAVRIKASQVGGSPYGIANMEGIFLRGSVGSIFMSRWMEGAPLIVDEAHFEEWRPAEQKVEAAETPAVHGTEDVPQQQRTADVPRQQEAIAVPQQQRTADVPRQPSMADVPQEQRVAATEIPARNFFPGYHWQDIWAQLERTHAVATPFSDKSIRAVQIELKELRDIPRRYWYLGNNSFLLHGYFNYQCLILGQIEDEDTRWFLGVPGIYQRQERVMAAIFGFPEFLPAAQEHEPEAEKNGVKTEAAEPVNRFGCWVRYIEE